MFKKLLVPVDLAHVDALVKALAAADDLAKHYSAEVCYLGVTPTTPTSLAATPAEYEQKLRAFADEQALKHQQSVSAHAVTSPDPVADLDDIVLNAIPQVNADLLVMATHLPRHLDAVIPAHGGKIATHTDISVFLVRQTQE